MFQISAFQRNAFQMLTSGAAVVSSVAGKLRKRAKELTRQRHRASVLAERYNRIRDQEEALQVVASVVGKYTPSDLTASLPPAPQIDFAALAKNRAEARAFMEATKRLKEMADEEEEIFNFMMALA